MRKYILKRLLIMIPMLLGITIVSYLIMDLAPGDAITSMIDPEKLGVMTNEQIIEARAKLGLDQPVIIRYFKWLGQILQGNFGYSYVTNGYIMDEIRGRITVTVMISLVSMLVSIVAGIALGVLCAVKQYKWQDYLISTFSFIGFSVPSFFLSMVVILIFSIKLGWFPAVGLRSLFVKNLTPWQSFLDMAHHCVLPIFVYSVSSIGSWARLQRASFLEVKNQDYVRTAISKGMSNAVVNFRHILRNASLPILTSIGGCVPALVSGSFIVESIFGIPGLGAYGTNAILNRDYPVVMATLFFSAILVMLGNLLSDILYSVVDPRIRY